jgi:hypothetical protein
MNETNVVDIIFKKNPKVIQLTLSQNYVSDWGVWEGIREFIQNARDSGEFNITYTDNSVEITTFSGAIDKQYLILGNTKKREDSRTIGTYGEGFKLAILVLLREGKKITIHNGRDIWIPYFAKHSELEHECLNIQINENVLEDSEEVKFIVEDLTTEEIQLCQSNTLYSQELNIVAEYEGSSCWMANNHPKIFVGGLYVCDLNKKYLLSYNFDPSVLQLDRDRKSVCTFSVSYQATRMVTLSGNYDLLSYLAEHSAEDISDYYSFEESTYTYSSFTESEVVAKKELKEIVSESFIKKHGEKAYPINNQWSDKEKRIKTIKSIEAGYIPVVIKSGYYKMLSHAVKDKKFADFSFNVSEEIVKFFEQNKKHLRSKSKKELEKIVKMINMIEGKELPLSIETKVVVDSYDLENVSTEDKWDDDLPF